ncbi:MAG: hypothetical protein P8Z78_10895 [Gammaproteobacteria bacterium]|jgi:hypothetical protein
MKTPLRRGFLLLAQKREEKEKGRPAGVACHNMTKIAVAGALIAVCRAVVRVQGRQGDLSAHPCFHSVLIAVAG